MPGDAFQKVKPGDPLTIPAAAYNGFVDAALDLLKRRQNQASANLAAYTQNGVIWVKNATAGGLDQFSVVGLGDLVITPEGNEREFRSQIVMQVAVPDKTKHRGRFAVLAEPLAAGAIGRAYAAGVCQAHLDVPENSLECSTAAVVDGETGFLRMAAYGSAQILWRAGGTGSQWAVVRLDRSPALFPVKLDQIGGNHGDDSSPASWTYSVKDPFTKEELAPSVDPTAAPHHWQRPSVGWLLAATVGTARFDDQGALVLVWINEIPEQEACDSSSG
ncbi:MAG: hypothetical protein ACREJ2_03200 [Planctomycetota bacterium]